MNKKRLKGKVTLKSGIVVTAEQLSAIKRRANLMIGAPELLAAAKMANEHLPAAMEPTKEFAVAHARLLAAIRRIEDGE